MLAEDKCPSAVVVQLQRVRDAEVDLVMGGCELLFDFSVRISGTDTFRERTPFRSRNAPLGENDPLRAEQVTNGITSMVTKRSREFSSVRVAMMAGTLQPKPRIRGTTELP